MPTANTVLEITAQVTEYQGNKQLNIQRIADCISHTAADFMPVSGRDINQIFDTALMYCTLIKDVDLQKLLDACLCKLEALWREIPAAVSMHHNYIAGTLVHCVDTANIAWLVCRNIPEANRDLVATGALLHDLGKLFSYKFNGAVIEMTNDGQLFEHSFIGANFVDNFAESVFTEFTPILEAKLQLLKHIILTHHGRLEYGAAVQPKCLEAHIVHVADGLSALAEQYRVASSALQTDEDMWTDKIYAIDNRPHVSTRYVSKLFKQAGVLPNAE